MSITLPSNARGPILDITLPAMELAVDVVLRNKTTGKSLTLNLPAKWDGDDLSLDFFRRTITDQTGADRSALLDSGDNELWSAEPLIAGANAIEIESVRAATLAGPAAPSTVEDDPAVGTIVWSESTLKFVKAEDGSSALAAVVGGASGITHYLKVLNFPLPIPAGSTVKGVLASIKRSKSGTSASVKDSQVRLVKAGVVQAASEKSTGSAWPAVAAVKTFGGATDLWGIAIAAADIDAKFGLAIAANLVSAPGFNCDAEVDSITLAVYYSDPAIKATLRWEKGYY